MSASPENNTDVNLDVAIIGGGIAGLWLLERLRRSGYQAALFSRAPLGSGQTVASQGMIHGGVKYTLAGSLSGASEAIADMPEHWRACLQGQGDVDLQRSRVLSDHFYMWSSSTVGRLTSFFASKALRGRVDKVTTSARPSLFQTDQFKGSLYRLVDMVLDVPSLVSNLAQNNSGHLFSLSEQDQLTRENNQAVIRLQDGTAIKARQVVLTAGKGNAECLHALGCDKPEQQLRPLRQLVVRHRHPHAFYGHCLGADKTPRLTISSHPNSNGEMVWYLGGSLAEDGAKLTDEQLVASGRRELEHLFPWLDFSEATFSTLFIERAEPRQPGLVRPDQAYAEPAPGIDNTLVAWPTKLTLVPNMAQQVLAHLTPPQTSSDGLEKLRAKLSAPQIASLPWERQ
ncbi:FAD-dependent oxidoreductase [Gilvimarinus sp. SDUM040013]|uniref:FAD-dependent oxidoreductase n=1 Tax=Gilvimarinus gilvus TaxID=3058038 RepID=A0ABU4RV78_9GAMM|nr:FAD-dependent oxidoreductase [Gilvimarinus sp. SDUM040013]MDO3387874.1 FAD-dependent oxidoreductase [Gilvimarinus sp. SDUM040013]MDX6848755.1 FAD-dependent oxidoreductase [Gilvimarinus sp. SDUM040013]